MENNAICQTNDRCHPDLRTKVLILSTADAFNYESLTDGERSLFRFYLGGSHMCSFLPRVISHVNECARKYKSVLFIAC